MTDAELDAIEQRPSRNDVSRLCAEVRRLRAALEEVDVEVCRETPDASHISALVRAALAPPANR